jgi:hypothetical protein
MPDVIGTRGARVKVGGVYRRDQFANRRSAAQKLLPFRQLIGHRPNGSTLNTSIPAALPRHHRLITSPRFDFAGRLSDPGLSRSTQGERLWQVTEEGRGRAALIEQRPPCAVRSGERLRHIGGGLSFCQVF